MAAFFDDYEAFFEGRAVQTDGSSVVLTNIATLNNARVDMWGDPSVNCLLTITMKILMKQQVYQLVHFVSLHS